MDLLPPEILEQICYLLTLKELIAFSIISKQWQEITASAIIRYKMKEITKSILVNMVKYHYQMNGLFIKRLPDNLKNYLCVLYAYLGNTSQINLCIENGAQWTDKAVSYAYCKEHLHLSDIYGYAGLEPAEIISLYLPTDKHTELIQSQILSAIQEQNINILKAINKEYLNYELWHKIKDSIIECENLDIIKWFLENVSSHIHRLIILSAIKKNRMDIIKLSNFMDDLTPIDIKYVLKAFKYGHIHFLEKNRRRYSAFTLSTELKSLPIRKWKNYTRHYNLEIMRQLLKKFPRSSIFIANSLAMNGYLESLQYIINYSDSDSCFFRGYSTNPNDIFIYAVSYGQLHVAEYILNDNLLMKNWEKAMYYSLINAKKKAVEWLFDHWNPNLHFSTSDIPVWISNSEKHKYIIKKKKCPLDNQNVRYYKLCQSLIDKYQQFYTKHCQ